MKKQLTAEFLGTYFLVLAGTGAIVINKLTGDLTHVGVALTFGLVVSALIFAFGHISGAHFNPAVTIGFLLLKKIDNKTALKYILVQCIGAVLASFTICYLFGNVAYLGATLPRGSSQQAFILEFLLTFLLVLVIFSSALHKKANTSFAAIAIGATVGLEAMFGGPITGASMNPARSLAPAIVSGNVSTLWIYLIATTLGAIAATYIYKIIQE
ncbi:MIP/aquaporin family protein [Gottfriedia acidiceleris]|uniref:Aquaporin n=1 Tax=Gottfriedia acidiceleris TaxID=371036 RepID=A0ABY4JQM7_9BACI|nr:aquaporin [Gottfriedia acidiceleris]UPM56146.1 aquaporin [Gottfriedia acidiceleris]